MESSILNVEMQRWANAIAKLTTRTLEGKLSWTKLASNLHNSTFSQGYTDSAVKYMADFEGNRFVLFVPSMKFAGRGWAELMRADSGSFVSLEVYDSNENHILTLPRLSILRGLADAVEAQTESREDAVLRAIENA